MSGVLCPSCGLDIAFLLSTLLKWDYKLGGQALSLTLVLAST